jgi:predicted transposase/invertase (TIGR01784 family)
MPDTRPFFRYIPFTSDYGFKVTFGNEHNTLFLRRALQALINLEQPIQEITFEKNTKEALTIEGRHIVYDLTCRLNDNEIAIVEMQLDGYPFMVKRMEYYASARMAPFVKKGKSNFRGIPRIYAIAILGYNMFRDEDHHRIACLFDQKHRLVDDSIQFIFLELEKFKKKPETCITDLDKLIYTMKAVPDIKGKEELPAFTEEEWLQSALQELESAKLTPEERADLEIAVVRIQSNRMAAEQWLEYREEEATKIGMEKGMEKGMKMGEEKGMKMGEEKGMKMGEEKGIKIGEEKGMEKKLRENISNVIQKHPEWPDTEISDLLNAPLDLVIQIRKSLT